MNKSLVKVERGTERGEAAERGKSIRWRGARRCLLLAACLLGLPAWAAAQTLGYTYNSNSIYQVDLGTGSVTTVWNFSPTLAAAAAIAQRTSDGMIFYIDGNTGNNNVYRWNPNTPLVAPVLLGSTGAGVPYLPRLTFNSTGTLYAVGTAANPNLYTIDTSTGAATPVGGALTGTISGGGDIAFAPNGTLYMMVGTTLYTVPTSGGAVTSVGSISGMSGTVTGLAFDSSGNLIASNSATPATLYRIPLGGGAATSVGTSSVSMGDLASALAPDLTLTKVHVGNFTQGQTGAAYTLTVRNSGNLLTSGTVTVTDAVPSGLTPTAASGTGWTCNVVAQNMTCSRSDALAAGATFPAITLTVNVASNAPATITNTASLNGGGEFRADNNVVGDTTTVNAAPDLTLAKTHSGNFAAGQTGATYTLTASNSGGSATSGTVTVTDAVPSGLTPTAASGTGWTCNVVAQNMTCSRSDVLAAGGSYPAITLTVNVASNAPASLTNSASITGGGQVNTGNDTASDPTTITGPPVVALVKAVAPTGTQPPGTDLAYQISFTNTGGTAAKNMVINDQIPTNTDFKLGSATISAGTTGLTMTIEYSNDSAATWTYTPVSAGGGAPAGYDRQVTNVRWRVASGMLGQTAPDNTGSVSFTVRIR